MTALKAESMLTCCESREGLKAGVVIAGSYRILHLIGSGGMGQVYEAEHLRLRNRVAVKVLRNTGDERSAKHLLREARLTASFDTDRVVRIIDCGTVGDGSPYVVMERLHGQDLRHHLAKNGPLPVQQALRLAQQLCSGLSDIHRAGVIHRDLKPANVFILDNRGGLHCKLLDLGIARSPNAESTLGNGVAGSVRYMAPEQLGDAKNVDERTDIYAAGAILYQCLTGNVPHPGDTVEEIMFSILHRRVLPVTELRPEVSASLNAQIMRALERSPSLRPRSAAEFAEALALFLSEPRPERRLAAVDDTTGRELPTRRQHRSWTPAVLALTPVVALVGFYVSIGSSRSPVPSVAEAASTHHLWTPVGMPSPTVSALATLPSATTTPVAAVAGMVQVTASKLASKGDEKAASVARRSLPTSRPIAPSVQNASQSGLDLERNPYAK